MVKQRMRVRRGAFALSAVVMAGASSAACAAVLGFERLSEEVPSESGALPEASTEASEGDAAREASARCDELGVPGKPGPVDAGEDATDLAPITMAVKKFDIGIDPQNPVGFNLDRTCTTSVATSSCTTKTFDTGWSKFGVDKGSLGVDNAGLAVLEDLSFVGTAFNPSEINARLKAGEFGVVVRLSDWNGLADDDSVTLEIFPAIGVWKQTAGGPVPGGTPTLTSADMWIRDRRFQNIVDASVYRSVEAYVTKSRVVASFETVSIGVSVPYDNKPFDIVVHEAFFSAPLVPDGSSWRLENGVLGGRWRTSDLLGQIRTVYLDDTLGQKKVVLCDPGAPANLYGSLKTLICPGRDIRGAGREDNKAMPCDSLSAGLLLDTYTVTDAGDFADLPAPIPSARCAKDGSVPLGDDCPPAAP